MKISLVVPCYNEQDNVAAFEEEARAVLVGYEYEIVFVNDGSADKTFVELEKLAKERKSNITVVDFSRNFGKEAAILAGLSNATGEYIAFVDADLQQPIEVVKEMLNFLERNPDYDAAAAYQDIRHENATISWLKKRFYSFINKISEIPFRENASDFRVIRRCVADSILALPEYFRFSKGIFSWVGYRTYFRPYSVRERNAGTSSWSTWKLFRYAIDGIISFSTMPLKLALNLGIITSAAAFLYLIVVIAQSLFCGIAIPGYTTIIVLILFLSGIQMILLGIQGEYLARVHIEVKHRPVYLVKRCIRTRKQINELES